MKRILNRMLRYADAIVKRGVDKLIDAIGQSLEPQTENAETPLQQKRMGNDTDCTPQTTGSTTNCGLTEQSITLMDYNVLDRTPEVQWRDQADKGFVPASKLVRNTMVTAPFNGAESDGVGILWCSMRFAANAENRRTKDITFVLAAYRGKHKRHKFTYETHKAAARLTATDYRPGGLKRHKGYAVAFNAIVSLFMMLMVVTA